MNLYITSKIVIPENELKWHFSRSSGPGGQNVNKTDSKVGLTFNIEQSKVLNSDIKIRIKSKLKKQLINGSIHIVVQEKRTQYRNRQIALIKLTALIKDGMKASPKTRRSTIPTQSSQSKRISSKKKRGEIKRSRQLKHEFDIS